MTTPDSPLADATMSADAAEAAEGVGPAAPTASPAPAPAPTPASTSATGAGTSAAGQPHPRPGRLRTSQSMKPSTAATKLGVHLPATPESFRAGAVTRDELDALQRTPPPWLVELRRNGPHPRSVVAARLRVSTSGLARAGLTEPLTTAQIDDLIASPPEWLHRERASLAEVRREEQRLRERDAQRRASRPPA